MAMKFSGYTSDCTLWTAVMSEARRAEAIGAAIGYAEYHMLPSDQCPARGGAPWITTPRTQLGVTWSHTGGVIERLRYAAERGILGAHVGHPIFMPMTQASLAQFWDDVAAAVPEWFGIVHYNTARCPNYLGAADYRVLADRMPNLVGVKQTTRDVVEFGDLVETVPELAHFTGEHALTPFATCGAVGVYSWFANVNARDDAGRWARARRSGAESVALSDAVWNIIS